MNGYCLVVAIILWSLLFVLLVITTMKENNVP